MDWRHRQRVIAVLALVLAAASIGVGRAQLAVNAVEPPAPARVSYHLRYTTDRPDLVHVTISFASPLIGEHVLVMPRAIPMGYGEQPFDEFVEALTALGSSAEPRSTERDEGPRWKISRAGEAIHRIAYDVNTSMLERRFTSTLATTPPFIRQMSLPELSRVASTRYSQDFRTGRNVFSRGG